MSSKIIGVGNTLFGDDGVGFYYAYALRECSESSVPIVSVETLDYSSLELIEGASNVVFIDAGNPGRLSEPKLFLLEKEELEGIIGNSGVSAVDPHDLSPLQLVYIGYSLGSFGGKAFFLVIPSFRIEIGFGLSRETAEKALGSLVLLENLVRGLGETLTVDKECFSRKIGEKVVYDSSP